MYYVGIKVPKTKHPELNIAASRQTELTTIAEARTESDAQIYIRMCPQIFAKISIQLR